VICIIGENRRQELFWGKAKMAIEALRKRDEFNSKVAQLRHRVPSGNLTLQQQAAIAHGLPMPTPENDDAIHRDSRKTSKGRKRRSR
jgi:hypothetical protein